jgi:hypothetical protein
MSIAPEYVLLDGACRPPAHPIPRPPRRSCRTVARGTDDMQWQAWISELLGDLLAKTPTVHSSSSCKQVSDALKTLISRTVEGNSCAFARLVRIGIRHIHIKRRSNDSVILAINSGVLANNCGLKAFDLPSDKSGNILSTVGFSAAKKFEICIAKFVSNSRWRKRSRKTHF